MKLRDSELNTQLENAVSEYRSLPEWMKRESSSNPVDDRVHDRSENQCRERSVKCD